MTNIRRHNARRLRQAAADLAFRRPYPRQVSNGEEERYPNRIANFSKGLPHNHLGEVAPHAYSALLRALYTQTPQDFERIPLGTSGGLRLMNPQAGLAYDLLGPDGAAVALPPPPRLDEAEMAGEMAELYWMALLRDVPFTEFEAEARVGQAAAALSRLAHFHGPRAHGDVTVNTLFRGCTPGDLHGPFVSQFLLLDVPLGGLRTPQVYRAYLSGVDYLTQYPDWLKVQNGEDRRGQTLLDPTPRYIHAMRDLAAYVHQDLPDQPYVNACRILLGLGAPLDPGNPYVHSRTQQGYGTFGAPHVLGLLAEVATRALKAVWFQKWAVHRRLRPEALGGLVHNHLTTGTKYPLHHSLLDADVLLDIFSEHGGYLLPQAFPEGCPMHPAYGAGHAAVAGACITILKAWFDENWTLPSTMTATRDGLTLQPYRGGPLTVRDELNKLAGNLGLGCCMAGINWRSDYTQALRLGEAIAISVLEEQQETYNEEFEFTFTRLDGAVITLAKQSSWAMAV